MLAIVVLLFGVCWLPLHVFILIIDFNPHLLATPGGERFFLILYYCVHWLAMSNSFANPIIYGFLNDSFRGDLKRLLRLWCPCCRELSCLKQDFLSRDSTYRNITRYNCKDSTSASTGVNNDPKRRLLSIRMNECGRCETELGTRDTLLAKNGTQRSRMTSPIR
ncbi:hypothetical protein LSH36_158g01007 [Paralvinella palmiformis]|uniref:G-protein coupled receptors family 1 profile domain-containing protein n=1 Tax=Paralvinella palmiformis TaxID=53620 RepID=A0AAD9N6N5_9ANNE|nr:hypothetical protein LSH36_158g01007 [Paralvinella palmiformis]